MNYVENDAKLALQRVFSQSMQLNQGETALLFLDSRTHPLCKPACGAAFELGLKFLAVYYPVHLQKEFSPPLASIYEKAFEEAQGVVTMLSESATCTRFRVEIVTMALQHGCKVVHMPGIDVDTLAASINIPYAEVSSLATTYREILYNGRKVEILTKDSTGRSHSLSFSIAGREGHADGGIVASGEIINFPTGEAYVAPVENSSEGSIVVNGSTPEGVLGNREIVLTFHEGKMIPSETTGTAEAEITKLLKTLEDTSHSDGGNSYYLGEFGIGCNRGYSKLTGRQVIDEKVAGTIHIALGANKVLGGEVRADTHLDLILWPVSVLIDGKAIVLPKEGVK